MSSGWGWHAALIAALQVETTGIPFLCFRHNPKMTKLERSTAPTSNAGEKVSAQPRMKHIGLELELTCYNSYAIISRIDASVGNILHAVGEISVPVYYKDALRNRPIEQANGGYNWYTILQWYRNRVTGSLNALGRRDSERFSRCREPVPLISYEHSREYGVVGEIQERDD